MDALTRGAQQAVFISQTELCDYVNSHIEQFRAISCDETVNYFDDFWDYRYFFTVYARGVAYRITICESYGTCNANSWRGHITDRTGDFKKLDMYIVPQDWMFDRDLELYRYVKPFP